MGRECPDCGSRNIEERGAIFGDTYICEDCGYTFG